VAPFANVTRLVEARLHRAGRRLGARAALVAGCVFAGLLALGFLLAAVTVALADRYGTLPALGIMAVAALVLLFALLLALSLEARRHRRLAVRQQGLDRQLFQAAAMSAASAVPRRMPSRMVAGLGLVALGAFLVLARRDGGED
jgi:hypothetical protein